MISTQIGYGGYGAVFLPPIGSNDTSMVGKVLFSGSSRDADIEWLNIKAIKKIDPEQKYFLYPIMKENIDVNEYNKYANTPVRHKTGDKFVQFRLKNGGVPLRNHHSPSLKQVLIYIIRIAQSIQIMLNNDIIHHDMHLGNIISGADDCRIIDFGLSRTLKEFYSSSNFLWNAAYAVNPPEFRLVQTRLMKTNNLIAEKELLAEYLLLDASFLDHIYTNPTFIESYQNLNTTLVGLRTITGYSRKRALEYLKSINSHETTDVYGLGIAMIEILTKTDFSEALFDVNIRLLDIITKMIMPHPKDRISTEIVIAEIQYILQELN